MTLPQMQESGKHRDNSVPLIGTIVTVLVVAAAMFVLFRDDGAKAPNAAVVPAPVPTPQPAVAEAGEGVPPRGGIAEALAEQKAPPPPHRTIYVVASQDTAWQLTMGLNESDAVRGGLGLAPLPFSVVVLPLGVDAYEALAGEDAAAREAGLPPADIVDLRQNPDQYLQP